jgi:hypothetical protein
LAEELREPARDPLRGPFRGSLPPAVVGRDQHLRASCCELSKRGECLADTAVVEHGAVLGARPVEVDAKKDPAPLDVEVGGAGNIGEEGHEKDSVKGATASLCGEGAYQEENIRPNGARRASA